MKKFYNKKLYTLEMTINDLEIGASYTIQRIEAVIDRTTGRFLCHTKVGHGSPKPPNQAFGLSVATQKCKLKRYLTSRTACRRRDGIHAFLNACCVHPTPTGVDGGRVNYLNASRLHLRTLCLLGCRLSCGTSVLSLESYPSEVFCYALFL